MRELFDLFLVVHGNQTKHALIMANSVNTKAAENSLRRSIAHATQLETILQNINFTVVKHANVFREEDILKNVIDFSKTYQNGDIVFVYFSCLAHQVNGNNYIIPVTDVNINRDEDVEAMGADFHRIIDRLTESQPQTKFIFIFDCCRKSSISSKTIPKSRFICILTYL